MLPMLRKTLKRAFPKLGLYAEVVELLVRRKDSYLHTSGWIRSLEEKRPVDRDGLELPWMNYPIIQFLQERLTPEIRLFEFGSGYSTMFFARLVKEVTSVEYDVTWFERIKASVPRNVNLLYQVNDTDGDYCRTVGSTGKQFDVVVIDGRDRVNCIKQGIGALSPTGVVLLDDSQRESYKDGFAYAKKLGFSALSFDGLKPTGITSNRTTVFYRRDNCLGL